MKRIGIAVIALVAIGIGFAACGSTSHTASSHPAAAPTTSQAPTSTPATPKAQVIADGYTHDVQAASKYGLSLASGVRNPTTGQYAASELETDPGEVVIQVNQGSLISQSGMLSRLEAGVRKQSNSTSVHIHEAGNRIILTGLYGDIDGAVNNGWGAESCTSA